MASSNKDFAFSFATITLGYLVRRCNLVRAEDGLALARVIYNVYIPVAVLSKLSVIELTLDMVYVVALGILFSVARVVLSTILSARCDPSERARIIATASGSSLPFTIPFINSIWGRDGVAAAFFFDVPNVIVLFVFNYIILQMLAPSPAGPTENTSQEEADIEQDGSRITIDSDKLVDEIPSEKSQAGQDKVSVPYSDDWQQLFKTYVNAWLLEINAEELQIVDCKGRDLGFVWDKNLLKLELLESPAPDFFPLMLKARADPINEECQQVAKVQLPSKASLGKTSEPKIFGGISGKTLSSKKIISKSTRRNQEHTHQLLRRHTMAIQASDMDKLEKHLTEETTHAFRGKFLLAASISKGLLKNVAFLATVLAVILNLVGLSLFEELQQWLDGVAVATSPTLLVFLGLTLSFDAVDMHFVGAALRILAARITSSVVSCVVLWYLVPSNLRGIAIFCNLAPASGTVVFYSLLFGHDPKLPAMAVAITNLISFCSMWVVAVLLF